MELDIDGTVTEFWDGKFCYRVDHSAPTYGHTKRRTYRLVGIEGYSGSSFLFDPQEYRPNYQWSRGGTVYRTARQAMNAALRDFKSRVKHARVLIAQVDDANLN